VIASQAGAASDQLAPSRKVVISRVVWVSHLNRIIDANTAINTVMKLSSTMRKRRASMRSASAPAGSVNRNIGRLLATCTMDTAIGSAFRFVISQAEEVSDMAMPVNENVVATQITENGRCENAPRRESREGVGSGDELESWVNAISCAFAAIYTFRQPSGFSAHNMRPRRSTAEVRQAAPR
jgi:hypothetical protein